jgi:hypothetical protein
VKLMQEISKLDGKGRVTIGSIVRKNGLEPSPYYTVTIGENGRVILTPAQITNAA